MKKGILIFLNYFYQQNIQFDVDEYWSNKIQQFRDSYFPELPVETENSNTRPLAKREKC